MESGAATARACYPYDHHLHEKQFQEFLTELGCENVPEDQIVSTLRNKTTQEISQASLAIWNEYNPSVQWPFQPVIDGQGGVIVESPIVGSLLTSLNVKPSC